MKIDETLRSFATVRQIEIIDAVNKYGSQKKAAKALGVCSGTIQNSIDAVKRKAIIQGYSPEHDMVHIAYHYRYVISKTPDIAYYCNIYLLLRITLQ